MSKGPVQETISRSHGDHLSDEQVFWLCRAVRDGVDKAVVAEKLNVSLRTVRRHWSAYQDGIEIGKKHPRGISGEAKTPKPKQICLAQGCTTEPRKGRRFCDDHEKKTLPNQHPADSFIRPPSLARLMGGR